MKSPNIGNMSTEVLDAICEQYKDDEDLVVSILSYLYHINQTDAKLTSNIEEICEDLGYCPDCSNKLTSYYYEEIHDELEYNNVEVFEAKLCSCCDAVEISKLEYKER